MIQLEFTQKMNRDIHIVIVDKIIGLNPKYTTKYIIVKTHYNHIEITWRNYKNRPESLATRVWEAVENDNTSENKKFLSITPQKIRLPETSYTGYGGRTILVKDVPAYARNLPEMFYRYSPKSWADAKKYQLQ
ncbi:19728_t:CDS:2 [Entrophospora sp. SA101]|nr:19728_t:CDS:2 [Entrophospora sp. SA101]